MQKKQLLRALAVIAFTSSAVADDEINYSFSVKDWNHKFKESVYSNNPSGTKTDNVNATILSVTARKGDYFITANALTPTTYSFTNGSNMIRRDTDIALGYSVNSNVSLLVGQKRLGSQLFYIDDKSTTNSTLNIGYLGVNGFMSIREDMFVYGTLTKSYKTSDTTFTAFQNTEVGLGYVLNNKTQLTVGSRYQKLTSPFGTNLPGIIVGANFTP
jgi:hypothetical protein